MYNSDTVTYFELKYESDSGDEIQKQPAEYQNESSSFR